MGEYLLRAIDIHKYFAGVRALDGTTLEIGHGEIHCLAGENGCGKSTLIKVISGVHQRDSGTLELNGELIEKNKPIDAILKGVQVIYQDFSVFPNLTVMENLAINTQLASKRKIVNWKKMRKIAEEAISKINFEVDLDLTLKSLSVAEKQMVAICRALMQNAKLLIMDEPTTALTKKEVKALFNVIKKLKEQGISILFVSHKLDEVFEISDRFTIMRNGKTVITGKTTEFDNKKFSYYMTGREFESKPKEVASFLEEPILEVKDISYKGSFENISFSLRKGEIKGITGLLDSGRLELALSLFGIRPITSGQILINGEPVNLKSPGDAIKHKIGYVPEDRLSEGLFLSQSIADNIIISEIDTLVHKGILDKEKYEKEVKEWVSKLSIATPDPENAASTLSGGNQQRIVLAKWLACKPNILILNGPTVGVDIGSKYDLHKILQELAKEGMAILIISDDLPEIVENCSTVLILKSGKIVEETETHSINEKVILDKMM